MNLRGGTVKELTVGSDENQGSTIIYTVAGHKENLNEIHQNLDFSYVRILKKMYHPENRVRLLAGSALAMFAYNSVTNQKDIADQGGVLFRCFEPFLQSDDEWYRCNAAFQVTSRMASKNSSPVLFTCKYQW